MATPQQPKGQQPPARETPLPAAFPGRFQSASLGADVLAGLTLAAVAIPECMGYTKIADTPVVTGLYTILLPILAFALLGSSRHLVVGADSATAAILFSGLQNLAVPFSAHWLALSSASALLTAGYLFLAGILRLGFLADFLSRSQPPTRVLCRNHSRTSPVGDAPMFPTKEDITQRLNDPSQAIHALETGIYDRQLHGFGMPAIARLSDDDFHTSLLVLLPMDAPMTRAMITPADSRIGSGLFDPV